jgi:putative hemolysin
MGLGYEILIILLMLFVNAIFAAYEMALASISRVRLSTLCQQKKRGAEEAVYMKDRMEASLAVIQLGITFAGAVTAATGGAGAHESFTPFFAKLGIPDFYAEILSLVSIVIPLSVFTIIFAELVPKMFALDNRESVCLNLSPIMKVIARIINPAVSFFETVVKKVMVLGRRKLRDEVPVDKQGLHELKAAAALARTSRLIGIHEEKIVLSAAQLSQRKVADIMCDADDISMIPATDSLSDALIKAHLDMHTRFPVCERAGDPQTIIGYLNFKDIVNALRMSPENPSVQGITRSIKQLQAEMSLSQALSEMMREKVHVAIAISQDRRVVGMITLEDIIEDLIGEIEDEFDRLPNYVQPVGSGWIVGGAVSITTIASTIGVELTFEKMLDRAPNFAEWVTRRLGREVEPGEVLSFDNISVTVRKLRRKRLAEAFVSKRNPL